MVLDITIQLQDSNMCTRRIFLAAVASFPMALLAVRPAAAGDTKLLIYDGAAIGGYDPVAYFSQSAPVLGDPAHSTTWKGAEWRFANAENKAAFEADPEAYAPQYGGFCAYAASKNAIAPTSPDAWTVHEGKLYLNYSTDVRSVWRQDIPGNIALADANWPGLRDQ